MSCNAAIKELTRAGRFMKGREALFSALTAVLRRALLLMEGANAEADPARRVAARAANFTMVSLPLLI